METTRRQLFQGQLDCSSFTYIAGRAHQAPRSSCTFTHTMRTCTHAHPSQSTQANTAGRPEYMTRTCGTMVVRTRRDCCQRCTRQSTRDTTGVLCYGRSQACTSSCCFLFRICSSPCRGGSAEGGAQCLHSHPRGHKCAHQFVRTPCGCIRCLKPCSALCAGLQWADRPVRPCTSYGLLWSPHASP